MRPARALLVGLLLLLPSHVWAATAASRNFDGADNSRVDFGDQTFLDNLTTFSVAFWVRLESQANDLRYLSKWGNAASEQAFIVFARPSGSGDEVGLSTTDGGGVAPGDYCIKYTSAANLATSTWYHVLATWTAPCTIVIYVNGVSQGLTTEQSGGTVSQIQATATTIQVGHETDEAVDGNEGQYGWLGLWTVVLSQADATTLASGVPPWLVKRESLAMCPVLWGTDAPEEDYCSAATGTVTGTTASAQGPPVFLPGGAP